MGWHKFTISNAQIAPIVTEKIKEKLDQLFWPLSCPKGVAVYIKKSDSGPRTVYYLTPSCVNSAKALIASCSAKSCEEPDMDSLKLIAGNSSL